MPRWRLVDDGRLLVDESETHRVADGELPAGTDSRLARAFVEQGERAERRFVAEVSGRVLIEPTRGWAVRLPNRLVAVSLPHARAEPHDTPSLSRYYAKRVLGRVVRHDEVVSLRDRSDWNYWHILSDVVPRLFELEDAGVPRDVPIVVSQHLHESAPWRAIVRRAGLDERSWVVQGPRLHVRSSRAWFASAGRYRRAHYERLLKLLRVAPPSDPVGGRLLFVTRAAGWRSVANIGELERIAASGGFEVVDPGEIELDRQIELFSEARAVVAVHGAALANTLFRAGAALDVLELFSPDWLESVYFQLCRQLGYCWTGLVGEPAGGFDFTVDPARFEAALGELAGRSD